MTGTILEAVENSSLTGLQSLVNDRDAQPRETLKKTAFLLPPLPNKCGSDVETDIGSNSSSRNSSRTASKEFPCAQGVSMCALELGVGFGIDSSKSRSTTPATSRRLPSMPRRR